MNRGTMRPKAKRADNTGSVYFVTSENRWKAQFKDGNGKLRTLSGKSEQLVVARLDRAIADRDKGILGLAPGQTPTLGQYLDTWLLSRYDLKEKTIEKYRDDIDRYIKPSLGHVRLDHLRAPMVETLYAGLLREAGLAPSSVKHVHATLSTALRRAYNHDILAINIMVKVKAPRVPEVKREIMSEQLVNRLLEEARSRGVQPYARWLLACLWGVRQGEALGLRWCDVDLDTGEIHIRQQMQYFPGQGMKVGTPKAEASIRHFKVPLLTLSALRLLKKEQAVQRLSASHWEDNDLVFCTDTGRPVDPANDRRQFKRILKACDGGDFRLHDARHTAITNMVIDRVSLPMIKKIVGHSDIRTTMSYIHPTDAAYEEAGEQVERRYAG